MILAATVVTIDWESIVIGVLIGCLIAALVLTLVEMTDTRRYR